MPGQPANSTIGIYRAVRAQRNRRMTDSVGTITKFGRPLVMSVPGRELPSMEVKSYNAANEDFSPWGRNGIPIVVGQHGVLAFENAVAFTTGIDFAFEIGNDKFLTNTTANLSRDLHKDLRAVETSKVQLSPTE